MNQAGMETSKTHTHTSSGKQVGKQSGSVDLFLFDIFYRWLKEINVILNMELDPDKFWVIDYVLLRCSDYSY